MIFFHYRYSSYIIYKILKIRFTNKLEKTAINNYLLNINLI